MKKVFGYLLLLGTIFYLISQAAFATVGALSFIYGPEIVNKKGIVGTPQLIFFVIIGFNMLMALATWYLMFAPPIIYRLDLWKNLNLGGWQNVEFKIIGWQAKNMIGYFNCIRKKRNLDMELFRKEIESQIKKEENRS